MTDFLKRLSAASADRTAVWEGDSPYANSPLYHGIELAGEIGELFNIMKKIFREAAGWRGSRASEQQLKEEFGDALICLAKLASVHEIELPSFTPDQVKQHTPNNINPNVRLQLGLKLFSAIGLIYTGYDDLVKCTEIITYRKFARETRSNLTHLYSQATRALYVLAAAHDVDLHKVSADKFNATSVSNGFPHRVYLDADCIEETPIEFAP